MSYTETMIFRAKPFVKWAGGKGSLLSQIDDLLPHAFLGSGEVTYVEPFVGGGALLFHVLNNYPNIKRAVINDINEDLISCYKLIQTDPYLLIDALEAMDAHFLSLDEAGRKDYYYSLRSLYNQRSSDNVSQAALFFFLNHTCFNGLYRVNSASGFNVPYGKNNGKRICNKELILADHKLLNKVNISILCGPYQHVTRHIRNYNNTFFYLDPPYMPISVTAYFKQYSNSPFEKEEQVQLKAFCDSISQKGGHFMLSNSDCKNEDGTSYFELLYDGYDCHRVRAKRFINARGDRSAETSEVVIRNYIAETLF